ILQACDAVPDGSRAACYRGIGKQSMGRFPERPDSVVRVCARASGSHSADCIGGIVEFWVDQEWKADSAFAFCAGVPAGMKEGCYRAIGERIAWIDPAPAALRATCAAAGAFAATCLTAAENEHAGDARPRAASSPPPASPAPRPATTRPGTPPTPHHHHAP
ncbi:MAG TPA: hypothetical protein VFS20_05185, partial [Longimicrobium sp.]|nr:hypothetical protein [Longimicrobium sp.]